MQIRSVLSLCAIAALALGAKQAEAVPFNLDFAAPLPVSCPIEDPGCADLEDVRPDPGGPLNAFLNYDIGGGDVVNTAAWTVFTGTLGSIEFGDIVQDIDTIDGGLGVDVGTDNIDAGQSIALFANFDGVNISSLDAFTLDSVVLGNHPGSGFTASDDFLFWYTDDATMMSLWQSETLAFDEINDLLGGLGEVYGVAFEALDGESTFYLSAAAGNVNSDIIPEPTTALLLGLGVAGLAMRRRVV